MDFATTPRDDDRRRRETRPAERRAARTAARGRTGAARGLRDAAIAVAIGLAAVLAVPGAPLAAPSAEPRAVQAERGTAANGIAETIRRRIFDWAIAFNEGRPEALCDLFSQNLRARVRGEPVRGREAMCDQFRRTATDPSTTLTYAPSVEDVLAGDDLVVAEVTWLLRVERGVVDTRFIERTQYVFRREDGTWRVVRLMSYVEPDDR